MLFNKGYYCTVKSIRCKKKTLFPLTIKEKYTFVLFVAIISKKKEKRKLNMTTVKRLLKTGRLMFNYINPMHFLFRVRKKKKK